MNKKEPAFLFYSEVAEIVTLVGAGNEVPELFRDSRILQITAALSLLEGTGGVADFTYLTEHVRGSRDTISKKIHRMADLDLVILEQDHSDQRRVFVYPTRKLSAIWASYSHEVINKIKSIT